MTTANERPLWEVRVIVMPKAGVNDPEGEAILGGLRSLGHGDVDRVRAGRMIALQVRAESADAARNEASLMADRLLANPVIETFTVEIAGGGNEEASK
jgi:phosphoribosylformylglycinamidine synthase subunit PurS